MELVESYYLQKIKEGLSLKQRHNPQYSLRAYARDIGVHPATLSQIINGKRPLPFKSSDSVAERLNLSPREISLFKESLLGEKFTFDEITISDIDKRVILDESHYKIIAEWEHYALLELFSLKDFDRTREQVAARLDLTPNRTEVVIHNLKTSGLVAIDEEDKLVKTVPDVKTSEDFINRALRDSHKETLRMGVEKIDRIPVELRDFSSSTLAIDMKKLPEAKALIRDFRRKLAILLEEGDKEEVYQIAVQFYPLSKIENKLEEKI
jgi:uncharacterized protein (TIGR02147 family)